MARHVILGGGPAATNAIQTIRQYDQQNEIVLLSDEPAHSRMALPYWIANQIPRERVMTGHDAMWQQLRVTAHLQSRARTIHPTQNYVEMEDGTQHTYDQLLIATGSRPLTLNIPGIHGERVQPLWNLAHVETLLSSLQGIARPRVTMIGAGFIGLIVLNAMYKRGWQLSVIEREPHVLPRMLNRPAASLAEAWLAERGVTVHTGTSVQAISDGTDGSKRVQMDNGRSVEADLVIVAIGVQPNTELATPAGIETDHGILVDDHLRTNLPNIFAAGDVAQGPVLHQDVRQIHAIQTTAVDHGRIAGANMAGHVVAYPGSLSMNVLDVCGLQCISYGNWEVPQSQPLEILNQSPPIYRNLLWSGDQFAGALFVGKANDLGMLTDAGMVKGFLQTGTHLGPWQAYLQQNPYDIRKPFIATGVAEKLQKTTLLGSPSATPVLRQATSAQRERPHLKTYQALQQPLP